MRVGMGYDVHRLTEERKLILGGVEIPWEKGLLGHSDADVLVHAVMDALLGAAALGDIGKHFPDTDPAYKGISSILLGLLGHSDADVLVHAVMDALLGAAALGDIGKHFPDTDPAYKGISSILLLRHVTELLKKNGYAIGNVDATIIAQKPKMAPHILKMRENMAEAMGISLIF